MRIDNFRALGAHLVSPVKDERIAELGDESDPLAAWLDDHIFGTSIR